MVCTTIIKKDGSLQVHVENTSPMWRSGINQKSFMLTFFMRFILVKCVHVF
jgi:hypothetical protein